jgi:putative transposase
MLKAVKVRLYPTEAQQAYLAQAFGCVRWVWNQSLHMITSIYQETDKGITAISIKKSIPLWKTEFEWLSECYSQCLQQSVLNLACCLATFIFAFWRLLEPLTLRLAAFCNLACIIHEG